MSVSSQVADSLGMGNYLLVTRGLAVVNEDLGLLADGVGVATHTCEGTTPHQQTSEQDV